MEKTLKEDENIEIIRIKIKYKGIIQNNKIILNSVEDKIILSLTVNDVSYFSENENIFDSLADLRKKLEKNDTYLLCNGSMLNVYPSGMQKEFGGTKAYKLSLGKQAKLEDIVDIFDYDDKLEISTVEKQRKFYNEWMDSFGRE